MDKAIVFGVWEELGFQLCKKILEEGIEVDGIHLNAKSNPSVIEEKRLQIGRNANFSEFEWRDFNRNRIKRKGIAIFIDKLENGNHSVESEELKSLLDSISRKDGKIIFFFPITMLFHSQYKDTNKQLLELIADLKKKGHFVLSFYLPPLNDPSFGDVVVFDKGRVLDVEEDRMGNCGPLYIEETVDAIIEMVRKY